MDVDYSPLKILGFSKLTIACYAGLYGNGGTIAASLAGKLEISQSQLYSALKQLEAHGFITKFNVSIGPNHYRAQPLPQALAAYHARQRQRLNQLLAQQEAAQPRPDQSRS